MFKSAHLLLHLDLARKLPAAIGGKLRVISFFYSSLLGSQTNEIIEDGIREFFLKTKRWCILSVTNLSITDDLCKVVVLFHS